MTRLEIGEGWDRKWHGVSGQLVAGRNIAELTSHVLQIPGRSLTSARRPSCILWNAVDEREGGPDEVGLLRHSRHAE